MTPHPHRSGAAKSVLAQRRAGRGLVLLLAAALLTWVPAGCLFVEPTRFYPSTVRAPHPDRVPPGAEREELEEMYTAGPELARHPMERESALLPLSRVTLVVWELNLLEAEVHREVYARSGAEQRTVVARNRALFDAHLVFRVYLHGLTRDSVDIESYLPEGVFLLDDRGRKFRPSPVSSPALKRLENLIPTRINREGEVEPGVPHWAGTNVLFFPRAAIGPDTRAVTLYFARPFYRVGFTWAFDESYEAAERTGRARYASGMKRLWRLD